MRIDPDRMRLKAEGMARVGGGRLAEAEERAPLADRMSPRKSDLASVGVTDVE